MILIEKISKFETMKEIKQQPNIWEEVHSIIIDRQEMIESFIGNIFTNSDYHIVITGAGSSAYVGDYIAAYLNKKCACQVDSIPTTDIVTCPELYFDKKKPTLLVSCARSGNSPESEAVFEKVDSLVDNIKHIVITCNENGRLRKQSDKKDNSLLLLMPKDSNDKGFAMTSSYTSMVMTLIHIFSLDNLTELSHKLAAVSYRVNSLFESDFKIEKMMDYDCKKTIFLSSNNLKGLAREASLKLLELTKGKIFTSSETYMGFRHGPKSIVDHNTLIFCFISSEEQIRRYEIDMIEELRMIDGLRIVVISDQYINECDKLADVYFYNDQYSQIRDDIFIGFEFLYVVQVYAVMKSYNLNIHPDNPCPEGSVNRVVKGVKIYK